MAVLFVISAVAVAVFEIDAEVFHRLAAQLLHDACIDDIAEARIETDGIAQRGGVGSEVVEGAEGERAEFLRRVALEEMRAAVDGVHRLPRARLTGEAGHEFFERRIELRRGGFQIVVGKGSFHHRVRITAATPQPASTSTDSTIQLY